MVQSLDPVTLTQELIRRASITPNDAGCLDFISTHLQQMGFTCYRLPYGEVDNLYARLGTNEANFCFAGHTDVVPILNKDQWRFPPFAGVIHQDCVYGRGAVDMKGAIAAFLSAVSEIVTTSSIKSSISFLLTSDEEGPAANGTKRVIDWLKEKGETITACLVGEPTNPKRVGEMIKIGRRGSLNTKITLKGKAGHVAYPHLAVNPIPALIDYIQELLKNPLDNGTDFFDASNLEVTTFDVGNTATNVILAEATAHINIRFNPLHTGDSLINYLEEKLIEVKQKWSSHKLEWNLVHKLSGEAFLRNYPALQNLVVNAIEKITGINPVLSTSGGTSDARFIKDISPVVEFGLINLTAHQIDERVSVTDLYTLQKIYKEILMNIDNLKM